MRGIVTSQQPPCATNQFGVPYEQLCHEVGRINGRLLAMYRQALLTWLDFARAPAKSRERRELLKEAIRKTQRVLT